MTILLISSDPIDTTMAGPGIRYWELAKHLSHNAAVILLTPNRSSLSHANIQIFQWTARSFSTALKQADVIVTQGFLFPIAPLLFCEKPLVIDLYDPLPIELLEQHIHLPYTEAQLSQSYCIERTKLLLQCGDFFLYCHDHQYDYWLGMLTAVGRVNHRLYRKNPTYSNLFGKVPYGMPGAPPKHFDSPLRGQHPGFQPNDTILLWGGGMWNWFDPCSVIRAMSEISAARQDIKLLFLGGKRADSDTGELRAAYATAEAEALSKQLGLYERTIFFHRSWVPYEDRQNYLLEANIGISTHFETLETRFSFRTRLLDYLWAELPIITTRGDYFSSLVETHQLGITVAPADAVHIQHAILRLSTDYRFIEQCRKNIRHIREQFFWKNVIKPLEEFCAAPYRTSSLNRIAKFVLLLKFYANTSKHLIQYRGYKKVVKKILQRSKL